MNSMMMNQGTSEFFFLGEGSEFNLNDNDLIKLIPYGVQMTPDGQRPILLLKDEKGEVTLPVPLNPLEAGITLTQSNKSIAPLTPHKVTEMLMAGLNLSFESCLFVEIKGALQYVQLNIKGNPDLKFIKVRADEAMSFCLHFNIPFYASKDFIGRSRVLSQENGIKLQQVQQNPELMTRQHKYVM